MGEGALDPENEMLPELLAVAPAEREAVGFAGVVPEGVGVGDTVGDAVIVALAEAKPVILALCDAVGLPVLGGVGGGEDEEVADELGASVLALVTLRDTVPVGEPVPVVEGEMVA